MPIVDRVTESARFCIKDQKRFQDSFFDLDVAAGHGSGLSAPTRASGRLVSAGSSGQAGPTSAGGGLDPVRDGLFCADG